MGKREQENPIAIFHTVNHVKGVGGRKKLKTNISMEKIFVLFFLKWKIIQSNTNTGSSIFC